jgi:hypothetical protein
MSHIPADLTPPERLAVTFARGRADRVPVMPKIWVDLAAALTGTDVRRVIEDPGAALRVLVDAATATGSDGARQFLFPARTTLEWEGRLWEVDDRGNRVGQIDLEGGWATRLERREDFRLDDPRHVAFHTSWTHPEPFIRDIADVRRMAAPDKSFFESAGYGRLLRESIAYAGDRVGLCGDCDSATLAFAASFRGMQQTLLDLIDRPGLVHAIMEKGTALAVERGKLNLDAGLRILRLNDSVANMSVISPRQWREFVFPYVKTVCGELHAYSPGAAVYCHICGNVLPIVGLLVEAGFDCIAPLDPLGGFTVADVRCAVGDEIVLMGGVDTLSFVRSTPEEIRREAARCIEQGDRDGRYILGSGCALPRASKLENILAFVNAPRAAIGCYRSNDGSIFHK